MLLKSSREVSKNFVPCLPLARECTWAASNLVDALNLRSENNFDYKLFVTEK